MKVSKRKGFNIELMLSKMCEARTLNPDGSISFSNLGFLDGFESYLRTAIEIEGKTDAFVRSVINKAMHEEQNLTETSFIAHCKRIAHIKTNKDQRTFKVLFPIWGSIEPLSGRRRWGDVSITFDIRQDSSFARRAKQERAEQLKEHKSDTAIAMDGLHSLPLALCSVKAIDVHDAFEQAENAISKELGLYSLMSSRGKFIVTTVPNKPINTILLAPYMTVHDQTGALSTDIFWYNQWPRAMIMKVRPDEKIKAIVSQAEKVRKRLKQLPFKWKHKAEEALRRHYSAFAQCDLEASFLDAWRLLEAIGGHSQEKSETLVERAAWFFEDRDEQYQTGLHLMRRRHLISHGRPVKDENNEALAFQMKMFLTPFLHAFLTNPFDFENIEELWSFCDLPVDKKARLRKTYLLHCSSRFRREK